MHFRLDFIMEAIQHIDLETVFKKFSKWQPSWISEWNDFSNSESAFCSDALYQVSVHSYI